MIPFFSNIFKSSAKRKGSLFAQIKKISEISSDISEKKVRLKKEEYSILNELQKEVYMSMTDFLNLMDKDDLSLDDIIKRCHHVSELTKTASVVEIDSVIEDGHIVLCPDKNNCEKHSNSKGSRLRIVTVRAIDQ